MGKLLKKLKKMNEESGNMVTKGIDSYISTGSYAFNGILSGKLIDGGIPCGRVTSIIGQSSSGKSLLAGMISANAQKKKYDVIWHDSEKANSEQFMEGVGCEWDKVGHSEIYTLEEYRNQMFQLLKEAETEKNPKYLFVLDSLGNLPTKKELSDAEKGHDAMDMGLRAKIIKSMTRILTGHLAKLDIPYLILNHGYQDPSNPMQKRLNPSGGQGVKYISTIMAEMTKSRKRDSQKQITGNIFKMTTTKNRLVPEEQTAEVLIDYEKGINPYYGLLAYAIEFGFIKQISKIKYTVNHIEGKEFKVSNIYVPAVWEPIMVELDKLYQEKYKFSSIAMDTDEKEPETELLEEG